MDENQPEKVSVALGSKKQKGTVSAPKRRFESDKPVLEATQIPESEKFEVTQGEPDYLRRR